MPNFEISVNIVKVSDEDGDFLAERSLDLMLPSTVRHSEVLRLLFVGFEDRLKAAGIKAVIGNFCT